MLLMSMVLIGLASAAPHGRHPPEAMLQNLISRLIEEAKQQNMKQGADQQYIYDEEADQQWYIYDEVADQQYIYDEAKQQHKQMESTLEEAMLENFYRFSKLIKNTKQQQYKQMKEAEKQDNKKSDQVEKTIALMNMIEQLREAKQPAKAEEKCMCFVAPCPRGCLDMTNKK